MRDELLNSKIAERAELKAQIKRLNARISTLEDEIIAEMDAAQAEEHSTDVYNIFWKLVESANIDTTKLREAFPEVAKSCTVNKIATRLTITNR